MVNLLDELNDSLLKATRHENFEEIQNLLDLDVNIDVKTDMGYSPLFISVIKNNYEITEYLLKHKADVNTLDDDNETPVVRAVRDRNIPLIKLLCRYKANIGVRDKDGNSLSDIARGNGDEKLAEWLDLQQSNFNNDLFYSLAAGDFDEVMDALIRGADVNAKSEYGQTPIHVVESIKIAEILLERGVNESINTQDADGCTPLGNAVCDKSIELTNLLLTNRADANQPAAGGDTPLNIAILEGDIAKVELLLTHGAAQSINTPNEDGDTPLHRAAREGHIEAVHLLLQSGAKINVLNDLKMTPIDCAENERNNQVIDALETHQKKLNNDLLQASKHGSLDEVMRLLNLGADINTNSNLGESPLYLAAKEGHLNIVNFLLQESNPDVNQSTQWGASPLHVAAREGHINIVKALLEARANINVQDKTGFTPLHWSCHKSHIPITQCLLRNGADYEIKSNKGVKALNLGKTGELIKSLGKLKEWSVPMPMQLNQDKQLINNPSLSSSAK